MYKSWQFTMVLMLGLLGFFLAVDAAENNLRDPTQPPSYVSSPITNAGIANNEIIIDAIYLGKNHSTALIGGKALTVGDKIFDATITAISSHAVKFKNENGEEFEVTMSSSNIKSPIIKNKTKEKNRENLD